MSEYANENELKRAIFFNELSSVQRLLAHHSLTMDDCSGSLTLLSSACAARDAEFIKAFSPTPQSFLKTCPGNNITPFHQFVAINRPLVVEQLLKDSLIDVTAKTADGVSPLHIAIDFFNLEIASLLITHGADVNEILKNGETFLHLAVRNKSIELIRFLLANGANDQITNKAGLTALGLARKKLYKKGVKALQKYR
jgi:ankyrin